MKIAAQAILKKIGEICGIIMLSGIVAALVSVYLNDQANVKLENSRTAISQRQKTVEAFDAAHADMLAKLTVFNLDMLGGKKIDAAKRAEVLQSIVKTELVANQIQNDLSGNDRSVVEDYKKELAKLSDTVETADQALALGGIYDALAHILPLHDKIADDARANIRATGLF